ncbi:MAG: hypothetical protein LBU60_06440 [Clostridiales bacterium]|nr:hypothetical protein [Clostridiales bacterium]
MLAGLKPSEIWDLELWEYNICIKVHQEKQMQHTVQAILTGYYCAYYMNGGKKAKNPNELIKQLHNKKSFKQSFEDGLKAIERFKCIERAEIFDK